MIHVRFIYSSQKLDILYSELNPRHGKEEKHVQTDIDSPVCSRLIMDQR